MTFHHSCKLSPSIFDCAWYTSNNGKRINAIVNEKITVNAVTIPKSRTTGIGENHKTKNPIAVVIALRHYAAPVVELVLLNASQG